jgi:hypothetical protein
LAATSPPPVSLHRLVQVNSCCRATANKIGLCAVGDTMMATTNWSALIYIFYILFHQLLPAATALHPEMLLNNLIYLYLFIFLSILTNDCVE